MPSKKFKGSVGSSARLQRPREVDWNRNDQNYQSPLTRTNDVAPARTPLPAIMYTTDAHADARSNPNVNATIVVQIDTDADFGRDDENEPSNQANYEDHSLRQDDDQLPHSPSPGQEERPDQTHDHIHSSGPQHGTESDLEAEAQVDAILQSLARPKTTTPNTAVKYKKSKSKTARKGQTMSHDPSKGPDANINVRRQTDGSITWQNDKGQYIPAVYHNDIRAELTQAANAKGAYDHTRRKGEKEHDETSFLASQKDWGEDKAYLSNVRDDVLNIDNPSSYPNHFQGQIAPQWFDSQGRIILDEAGDPVLQYPDLPDTLSSQIEAFFIVAVTRLDRRIRIQEVWARIPRDTGATTMLRNRVNRWLRGQKKPSWNLSGEAKRPKIVKSVESLRTKDETARDKPTSPLPAPSLPQPVEAQQAQPAQQYNTTSQPYMLLSQYQRRYQGQFGLDEIRQKWLADAEDRKSTIAAMLQPKQPQFVETQDSTSPAPVLRPGVVSGRQPFPSSNYAAAGTLRPYVPPYQTPTVPTKFIPASVSNTSSRPRPSPNSIQPNPSAVTINSRPPSDSMTSVRPQPVELHGFRPAPSQQYRRSTYERMTSNSHNLDAVMEDIDETDAVMAGMEGTKEQEPSLPLVVANDGHGPYVDLLTDNDDGALAVFRTPPGMSITDFELVRDKDVYRFRPKRRADVTSNQARKRENAGITEDVIDAATVSSTRHNASMSMK